MKVEEEQTAVGQIRKPIESNEHGSYVCVDQGKLCSGYRELYINDCYVCTCDYIYIYMCL